MRFLSPNSNIKIYTKINTEPCHITLWMSTKFFYITFCQNKWDSSTTTAGMFTFKASLIHKMSLLVFYSAQSGWQAWVYWFSTQLNQVFATISIFHCPLLIKHWLVWSHLSKLQTNPSNNGQIVLHHTHNKWKQNSYQGHRCRRIQE